MYITPAPDMVWLFFCCFCLLLGSLPSFNVALRHNILTCIVKMLHVAKSELLANLLRNLSVSSYVAGMLGSHDKLVVIASLEVYVLSWICYFASSLRMSPDCGDSHGKTPPNLRWALSAPRLIDQIWYLAVPSIQFNFLGVVHHLQRLGSVTWSKAAAEVQSKSPSTTPVAKRAPRRARHTKHHDEELDISASSLNTELPTPTKQVPDVEMTAWITKTSSLLAQNYFAQSTSESVAHQGVCGYRFLVGT